MSVDWAALRERLLGESADIGGLGDVRFPILPHVLVEFTNRADNPHSSAKELGELLESDSGLTCELLKQVNSCSLGLRHKASSVKHAISLLGVRRSKLFLLSAAMRLTLRSLRWTVIDPFEFNSAGQDRSLFARETALTIGGDPDIAYTAALLQDVFLPFMAEDHAEAYRKFYAASRGDVEAITRFERDSFGFDHAQAAAAAMRQWGFPDELICAVYLHHTPAETIDEQSRRKTAATAAAVAALLPDTFHHSSAGMERLAGLDNDWAAFNMFEIAEKVDESREHTEGGLGQHVPLVTRLEKMFVAHLQQSVHDPWKATGRVGSYVIEEKIGEGAMGAVYRGRHHLLQRPAAVKILDGKRTTAEAIRQFEREVRITCRLSHPNTVSIYDFGRTDEGTFYYAMEYLDGITLRQLIDLDGPQSEGRTIHILRQICGSLSEAHSHGLVHRDIKPENVIILRHGGRCDIVKVLDFGLVTALAPAEPVADRAAVVSGTPHYLSPEAIRSPGTIDGRSDLYAAALVGYFLLTGKTAFSGKSVIEVCSRQVLEMPQRPSVRAGRKISEDLERLLMQCLEKNPSDRPDSVDAFAEMLSRCSGDDWDDRRSRDWWERHENLRAGPQGESETVRNCGESTIIGNLDDLHHEVASSSESLNKTMLLR